MRRRLFLLLIALHALVLVGWAASLEWALARAATIRVAVVQRDPRDLLRGDYVWLQFPFSEIDVAAVAGARPERGDRMWIALAPRDGLWELAGASLTRQGLPLAPGQRVLAGRVESWVYEPPPRVSGPPRRARVGYGIERYYVPEGKGTPPRGKLEAELALTDDGRPFLRRLFVDGQPYP